MLISLELIEKVFLSKLPLIKFAFEVMVISFNEVAFSFNSMFGKVKNFDSFPIKRGSFFVS